MARTPYYLVVDLEATCCDDGSIQRDEQETIEIGAVLVDGDSLKSVGEEFNSFIKPVRHPVLTDFCIRLTSIMQADVNEAMGFQEAFVIFCNWCADRGVRGFCSWGDFDRKQLEQDCRYHRVVYPFTEHLNLSKLFTEKTGRRRGNRRAAKSLGLKPEGIHHRGIDDARNIARMLPLLLRED